MIPGIKEEGYIYPIFLTQSESDAPVQNSLNFNNNHFFLGGGGTLFLKVSLLYNFNTAALELNLKDVSLA